jgi:hypothetical protein
MKLNFSLLSGAALLAVLTVAIPAPLGVTFNNTSIDRRAGPPLTHAGETPTGPAHLPVSNDKRGRPLSPIPEDPDEEKKRSLAARTRPLSPIPEEPDEEKREIGKRGRPLSPIPEEPDEEKRGVTDEYDGY